MLVFVMSSGIQRIEYGPKNSSSVEKINMVANKSKLFNRAYDPLLSDP